jgi:F-type H+-transporting ATPase subunit b
MPFEDPAADHRRSARAAPAVSPDFSQQGCSSMQRRSNLAYGIGVLALILVLAGSAQGVWAQEAAHGVQGSSPAAAHGGSTEGSGQIEMPLKFEPTLTIWTLVVFIGLLAVLGRYAWKPLLHALHERERHLEHVLTETERARNESEGLLSEHRKQMARAADEVRALLDKARQEAQATADQIVKQAQGEAEAARQRAQRDIASARDQALAEIWEKSADVAVSVAGRVLAKQLSDDDHRRLLDAAIRELPAAAGTNGQGGRRG